MIPKTFPRRIHWRMVLIRCGSSFQQRQLPIHARRAAVCTTACIRVGQDVLPPHLVIQKVKPPRRLLLGLYVERSLELPNLFRGCQAHANPLLSARSNAPRTRAPFIHRRWPASSDVWTPPTPAEPASRGGVARKQFSQVSRVASSRVCVRAAPHTPASRTTVASRLSGRPRRPSSTDRRLGARITTFEACSGFTRVAARTFADPSE
jgi:hypothetical protein